MYSASLEQADISAACKLGRKDLFVGGTVDIERGLLHLINGAGESIEVPLSIFKPSGTCSPDFTAFRLDDCGNTVCFGEYEASSDYILGYLNEQQRADS